MDAMDARRCNSEWSTQGQVTDASAPERRDVAQHRHLATAMNILHPYCVVSTDICPPTDLANETFATDFSDAPL